MKNKEEISHNNGGVKYPGATILLQRCENVLLTSLTSNPLLTAEDDNRRCKAK